MKIIKKMKLEALIHDVSNRNSQIDNEIEALNKEINECYLTIGKIVIEKSFDIPDISYEKEKLIDKKQHIEKLLDEKEHCKKELYLLEESRRNLNGKIGCPNCGRIYEKTSEMSFCSKCGAKLILEVSLNEKGKLDFKLPKPCD